ncbi:MAG: acetolactate synthase small subunit [Oscillospiraceae bacterium]|jgi:acetolactate synthase-1/3 small subunit|nr:acetolactate synthase small subunit [Oscillospiraceae bacterium]
MTDRFVLSVLVNNQFGVLTRIAGLFARRGYNIDALTVAETENPAFSRMTVVVGGDDYVLEQIVKQLMKQVDVRSVERLTRKDAIFRELLLVKVGSDPETRQDILALAGLFDARVTDWSEHALTIELTDQPDIITALIDRLRAYPILEICRTGLTAIPRGDTAGAPFALPTEGV